MRARAGRAGESVAQRSTAPYGTEDHTLGYRFAPQVIATVEKTAGSRLVYSATYASDRHGRRIAPGARDGARERFAVFFGDSMIFGEGLQAEETIPHRFGLLDRGTMPYNYAYMGYGPQQMMLQIAEPGFAAHVAEPTGIAIYGYFDYHINRVVGSTEVLRWNPGYHPYLSLEGGDLVHHGTFLTGRPRLTAWYARFNRIQIFRALGIELPIITEAHRRLLCEIIDQSRTAFERKFPGSRFVVMMSPLSSGTDEIHRACFEPRRIAYLDLRGLFGEYGDLDRRDNPYRIPGDGHYSAAGAALIASALHDALVTGGHREE